MEIPINNKIGDIYSDLIETQCSIDYDKLRPTDITRHILMIFEERNLKDLTVDIVHGLIQKIHENFEVHDYCNMTDFIGFNLLNEVTETINFYKENDKNNNPEELNND